MSGIVQQIVLSVSLYIGVRRSLGRVQFAAVIREKFPLQIQLIVGNNQTIERLPSPITKWVNLVQQRISWFERTVSASDHEY